MRPKYRRHHLDVRVDPLEHLYRNDLALRQHPPGLVHPPHGFGHALKTAASGKRARLAKAFHRCTLTALKGADARAIGSIDTMSDALLADMERAVEQYAEDDEVGR